MVKRILSLSGVTKLLVVGSAVALIISPLQVSALDSDSEQPATLEANDFELDLKTGVRTYRGDVLYRQGSIRLECDELVTYFNDEGELDKAFCTGDPGRFKQRPEDSEEDMIGIAREITLDQIKEMVTLKSNAQVEQGNQQMSGRLLTYNLATEKVIVKGDKKAPTKTTAKKSDEQTASTEKAGEASTSAEPTSSRATLIIQPRKKKKKN